MSKSSTISTILERTGKAGDAVYFDKLSDLPDSYLNKLAKVVEKLGKNVV